MLLGNGNCLSKEVGGRTLKRIEVYIGRLEEQVVIPKIALATPFALVILSASNH